MGSRFVPNLWISPSLPAGPGPRPAASARAASFAPGGHCPPSSGPLSRPSCPGARLPKVSFSAPKIRTPLFFLAFSADLLYDMINK